MGTPENSGTGGLLLCPQCRQTLEESESQFTCAGCDARYPILDGIPLLLSDPTRHLNAWADGLDGFISQMNHSEKQLLVELLDGTLTERGQNRVRQVISGLGQHRDEVVQLLGRVGIRPKARSTGGRSDYSPETYFTLIHRDYAWAPEVDEVRESWERLLQVLPSNYARGTTLMLGAGTGRLAWQMAAEWPGQGPVIAVDINPLPMLITARLLDGAELRLTELPAHPKKSSAATLTRSLTAPLPRGLDLKLVLADGLNPPVPDRAFDTVVTPWFVDQVPEDAADIPLLVNGLLREGGSYICTGPFLYDAGHTKPSLRYCADEFIEHVKSAGFEVTRANYREEPYVASPLSTQGRKEHVLYMHARKVSEPPPRSPSLPPFLRPGPGASEPIPVPEGLLHARFSEPTVSAIASLLDGRRSVLQVTEVLIERGVLADDGTADAAVRGCLKLIWKELRVNPPGDDG